MSRRQSLGKAFLRGRKGGHQGVEANGQRGLWQSWSRDADEGDRSPATEDRSEPNRTAQEVDTEPIDPGDVSTSEAVRRAADDLIRREAIRQLDTIDLEDADPAIEPLPPLDGGGIFDAGALAAEDGADGDVSWDTVVGRFVPDGDDHLDRS